MSYEPRITRTVGFSGIVGDLDFLGDDVEFEIEDAVEGESLTFGFYSDGRLGPVWSDEFYVGAFRLTDSGTGTSMVDGLNDVEIQELREAAERLGMKDVKFRIVIGVTI